MATQLLGTASHNLVEAFDSNTRAWRLTRHKALVLALLPILFVLAMGATVRVFSLFYWLTAEDSVIEWLQFFLILASSLLFARIGILLMRRGQYRSVGLLYLLVAIGAFFVAGEEIAWGQRIFGWETPEQLEAVNYQSETTFHNISSVHQLFIWASLLAGMYGTVMPLLALRLHNEQRRSRLTYLLVPPLFLVPAFFMPFSYRLARLFLPLEEGYWYSYLNFPISKFSEVTEVCLYYGLLVFAWLNLRRLNGEPRMGRKQ